MFKIILALFLCTVVAGQEHFPNDPKPCNFGDTNCIKERSNYFFREKATTGDSAINLVTIDPLYIAKMNLKQGAESPVAIDLTFTDTNLFGLKAMEFTKVKGFGEDLATTHEIYCKVPLITLLGDYSIKGKVLILPISGTGKSNMTLVNSETRLSFTGVPFQKNGETFMKTKNLKIVLKPQRLYYHFTNLFNGDKALGDNMNAFLNENWDSIYSEVQESIHKGFAKVYDGIITEVFSKYPYAKYFAEQ